MVLSIHKEIKATVPFVGWVNGRREARSLVKINFTWWDLNPEVYWPWAECFTIVPPLSHLHIQTYIATKGNLDLVFALIKMIIIHATITHKQNNEFALVLVHNYTIICPTTVEKDVSVRCSVCFPPRNKRFVTNWGNLDRHGVIRTTT